MIADEDDGFDAGLLAFGDMEDDVDAAVRKIDDPVGHFGGCIARAAVDILDSLHVGIDGHLAERTMRLRLDLGLQLIRFDLAVSLEENAIDDVVFDDVNDEFAALARDMDFARTVRSRRDPSRPC